ncbi:MAG: calcium-translocating P-type ATPase, SERCA-type [Candidatus Norongarragalinales archaeon]
MAVLKDFHALSSKSALKELDSGERGLTESEAEERLSQYGPNELKEKKGKHPIFIFLEQFSNILVLLLMGAAGVSWALGEVLDAAAIMAIVVLNAVFGFVQEYRAEQAIAALKKLVSPKARVLRGGREVLVESKLLVPGDVVVLEAGDRIPADCRLLESIELECEESALTGESLPVRKNAGTTLSEKTPVADRENMVFMGTAVTKGRAKALVCSTGMNTQVGKIATLVEQTETEETPLQKRLEILGKQLGIASLAAVAIVFFSGVALSGESVFGMFLIAVTLAVAAIPEGLPAIVTVTMAVGVQRMAKRNAIIRKLPAVETLGAATVICSDKTGTLTKSEMTVREVYANGRNYGVAGSGYALKGEFFDGKGRKIDALKEMEKLLLAGVYCNNSSLAEEAGGANAKVAGDPTEASLLVLARKAGLDEEELKEKSEFIHEIPFSSERKMMSVARKHGGKSLVFVKGAPEVVVQKCTHVLKGGKESKLALKEKQEVLAQNKRMALKALRVLALAFRKFEGKGERQMESDLVFLGLVGMMDPPRPEAKRAVEACKAAGIRVVMITGDNKETALAVGRELGVVEKDSLVLVGSELDETTDEELAEIAKKAAVYARVSPEHKLRIVKAIKADGRQVVAMTGDGVNDAPAIKKADIGVGMGLTGTDVTKEASAMVITDDNFASIVNAIEEGRIVFDNISKSVRYLISCNIGELLAVFTAVIMGLKSPLEPLQILWMNLATDGLPALALGVDPEEPGVMERKPRDPSENIINRKSIVQILEIGVFMAVATVGIFWLYHDVHGIEYARSMAFTTLVFIQIAFSFSVRSKEHALWENGPFSNKTLIAAALVAVALQIAILYTPFFEGIFSTKPLLLNDLAVALGMASLGFIIPEVSKIIRRKKA